MLHLCRLCPQKQRLGSTRKFVVGWTGAYRTDFRRLYAVCTESDGFSLHVVFVKWQVFKRTVKFGFVTEDMSDIVQRYKASTVAPNCIDLYLLYLYSLRQSGVG